MRRALCLPFAFAALLLACEKSTPPTTPPDAPADPGGPVCTMEAKMCPDGSAVGRTGPNCEFAACPGE